MTTPDRPWIFRNPDSEGPPAELPENPLSPAEQAQNLEELRQYFLDLQASRPVVTRTRTAGGQLLDWVEIESQVLGGRVPDPPTEDRLDPDPDDGGPAGEPGSTRLTRFELERQPEARGPAGTVPIPHVEVDRLQFGGGLQEFLSKSAGLKPDGPGLPDEPKPPVPKPDPPKHVHAGVKASPVDSAFGCEGSINIWSSFVEWSDEFSLGQFALIRGTGNAAQTIEAGTQVYPLKYGDFKPHLFIYYTTNGYTKDGPNIGGYNRDVTGWSQFSNVVFPEALLTPSQLLGTQMVMPLKCQLFQGNWWIRVNGRWMGFYPASLFNSGGLAQKADRLDWYGEVFDQWGRGTTQTDMGSGNYAKEHWQRSAYMRNLLYQNAPDGTMDRFVAHSTFATKSGCYSVEDFTLGSDSWASHIWYGGPGRSTACP